MSTTPFNNLRNDLEAAHQLIEQLTQKLKKTEKEKVQIITEAKEAKVLFEEEKALLLQGLISETCLVAADLTEKPPKSVDNSLFLAIV